MWAFDVKPYQIIGIPDWAPRVIRGASGGYRIDAVASHPMTDAECKAMVQRLLTDRYKMIAHRGPRETPVYALVTAKNGPKMAKADEGPGVHVVVNGNPMGVAAGKSKDFKGPSGWSMDYLADFLRIGVDCPVVNRTGLDGLYKINLSFSSQGFSPAVRWQWKSRGKRLLSPLSSRALSIRTRRYAARKTMRSERQNAITTLANVARFPTPDRTSSGGAAGRS